MSHQHAGKQSTKKILLVKSPSPKSPKFSPSANGPETPSCYLYYKCLLLRVRPAPSQRKHDLESAKPWDRRAVALHALEGMIPDCSLQRRLWNFSCSVQGTSNRRRKRQLCTGSQMGMREEKRAKGVSRLTYSPRRRSQIFSICSGCRCFRELLSNSSISLVGDSIAAGSHWG